MILNSFARKILLGFGVLSTFLLTAVVAYDARVSIWYPILLGSIGIMSMAFYTSPKRKFYLPVLWTMFYFFGYVLAFADVIINSETAGVGFIASSDVFDFNDSSFFNVFFTILVGMASIFLSTVLCESMYNKKPREDSFSTNANKVFFSFPVLLLWSGAAVTIIMIMGVLGIGRTGIPDETALPFKLVGILVYMKNFVIPFTAFLVFVGAVKSKNFKYVLSAFVLILSVAAISAVVFLSRGQLVIMILPPLMYVLFAGRELGISKKQVFQFIFVTLAVLIVAIPFISVLRELKYAGVSVDIIETVAKDDKHSLSDSMSAVITLSVSRILGFRELVAVHDYHSNDLLGPLKMFLGNEDYTNSISKEILGFSADMNDGTAFGVAFGLWGMLYLSGSNLVVFVGTFLATALIFLFESLFTDLFDSALALFVAIQFGLWIWGGIDYFLLSRLLITAIACYFLVKLLIKTNFISANPR